MQKYDLELDGFLESNNERSRLYVRIYSPEEDQEQQNYFCLVHAPALLNGDKKIYGINSDQARSLARGFIKALLQDKIATDETGTPIIL